MFFILNKLSDIFSDHSYVSDLVIRDLSINKADFIQICKSFCNITSIAFIDCPNIEFTAAIGQLKLQEISITNCGFDDADLAYLNDLDLKILNLIDLTQLDVSSLEVLKTVENLSIIYCQLVHPNNLLKQIKAQYLDVRGSNVDLQPLLANTTVKKLITTCDDIQLLAELRKKQIELKLEQTQ